MALHMSTGPSAFGLGDELQSAFWIVGPYQGWAQGVIWGLYIVVPTCSKVLLSYRIHVNLGSPELLDRSTDEDVVG